MATCFPQNGHEWGRYWLIGPERSLPPTGWVGELWEMRPSLVVRCIHPVLVICVWRHTQTQTLAGQYFPSTLLMVSLVPFTSSFFSNDETTKCVHLPLSHFSVHTISWSLNQKTVTCFSHHTKGMHYITSLFKMFFFALFIAVDFRGRSQPLNLTPPLHSTGMHLLKSVLCITDSIVALMWR